MDEETKPTNHVMPGARPKIPTRFRPGVLGMSILAGWDKESVTENRPSSHSLRAWTCGVFAGCALAAAAALAEDAAPPSQPNLVTQANAPLSSVLQLRLQEGYQPEFKHVDGDGNVFLIGITMPLPKYRLLPFPQLSLLTIPAAVTPPLGSTGFGDVRFIDVAVFQPHGRVLWGLGPTLVFPTASEDETGQGKWQAGPAFAAAYTPGSWLAALLAHNPISFAGDDDRLQTNTLFLQPTVSVQLGKGWFVRSVPLMAFNWKTDKQLVPIDLGAGRVFKIGRQNVSCFIEPFYSVIADEPAPKYGVTFGVTLLYPNFWGS